MSVMIITDPVPLHVDSNGVVRVGNTRVTLDTLIGAFLDGATAEEISQQYPSLNLADVYAVIGYYLRHSSEVDSYLRKRRQVVNDTRTLNETRNNPQGIRARLLARQKQEN